MNPKNFQLPERWSLQGADKAVALFTNAEGDRLSINHFPLVPDIAADITDAAALRAFYRAASEAAGVAMVEVDPIRIAGLQGVRTILKARLDPAGFAFVGSLTLPFEDHSYVIKVQGMESGVTGARESAVMAMQQGAFERDERTGKLVGWEQDPYDPATKDRSCATPRMTRRTTPRFPIIR